MRRAKQKTRATETSQKKCEENVSDEPKDEPPPLADTSGSEDEGHTEHDASAAALTGTAQRFQVTVFYFRSDFEDQRINMY